MSSQSYFDQYQAHAMTNRRIIIGVTGGIAAYKAVELIRLLKKAGAEIIVVTTPSALDFVGALTFQAVSGNEVHTELLDETAEAGMGHIELAKWAQDIIIAPASANTLAKLSQGLADNLLTTICLATRARIFVAPSMNQAMWQHPAMRAQMHTISGYGYSVLGPASGEQACGDNGPGRMLEPIDIVQHYADILTPALLFKGKKIVITAGPTQEAIDPVRYLSNHSSGKMGYAIAQAAHMMGAHVELISGPTALTAPNVNVLQVTTAQQMLEACLLQTKDADIFISAAAVADYQPEEILTQKMKKGAEETITLTLVKTPDIVQAVSQQAKLDQSNLFCIGFAAETENIKAHSLQKLERKGLDMIIANDVSRGDIGFNSSENEVTVYTPKETFEIQKNSKYLVATQILSILHQQTGQSLNAVNSSQNS